MGTNIFVNPTQTLPKTADPQIVRVNMDQSDLGGRKSHLPGQEKNDQLSISHVPNAGTSK